MKDQLEKEMFGEVEILEMYDGFIFFKTPDNNRWYARITATGRLKKHSIRADR